MKNIHLLSTPKPSRLFLKENTLLLNNQYTLQEVFPKGKCQNIYITSDEEIKDGYYLDLTHKIIMKSVFYPSSDKNCKKIILTTDADLIKYGVQAIDDEFLDWFVKNPSCEFVEIYREKPIGYTDNIHITFWGLWKIIIPKEDICSFCDGTGQVVSCTTISRFKTCDCKTIEDEPKQETFVNEKCFKCGRSQYSSGKPFCTDDFCNKNFYQKPKQETLEEAAKIHAFNFYEKEDREVGEQSFIAGAKWQQERSYSEEEVLELVNNFEIHLGSAKVEEMMTFKKWFEQFEKK